MGRRNSYGVEKRQWVRRYLAEPSRGAYREERAYIATSPRAGRALAANTVQQLREDWVSRISEAQLLTAMTKEEISPRQLRSTTVMWSAADGNLRGPTDLRSHLSERISPGRRKRTKSSASCCCCATSWRVLYSPSTRLTFEKLNRILDAYEPAANRIATRVAVGFGPRARARHPPNNRRPSRAVHSRLASA